MKPLSRYPAEDRFDGAGLTPLGTIEEGMLSVLTFKKSLFAGVLDGGEREVFLGGSRLSRFMETVEKTTTAIAQSPDVSSDRVREVKPHGETGTGSSDSVAAQSLVDLVVSVGPCLSCDASRSAFRCSAFPFAGA